MIRRASIDIGSNSILLLIADVTENGFNVIANESRVTGLGRNLDLNKKFIPEAMDESLEALKEYKEIAEAKGIESEDILITATEASRVATNAKDFFQKIKQQLKMNVTVINGLAEAYFSTKGILAGDSFEESEICIMDIGGASTELIKVNPQNSHILKSFSMPIGVVRMTNWINEKKLEEEVNKVYERFSSDLSEVHSKKLYCVAGTMTSIANMHLGNKAFVENQVHGHVMKAEDIFEMRDRYKSYSADEMLNLFPFLGKRSKTIQAGLILATEICERLAVKEVVVSTYGLRYGTLIEGEIKSEYIFKF